MKNLMTLLTLACLAAAALAHQPVIVGKDNITIEKPEISRAFYGELTGQPRSYFIKSDQPFDLYVGLLVPRNTNAAGQYSAKVYRLAEGKQYLLTAMRADSVIWKEYYEDFGGDYYLKGPDWKQSVPAGAYEINVYSQDNLGKYVLVVGEGEFWGPKELFNVYTTLPQLKGNFFGENPLTFLKTPFGIALLVVIGGIIFYLVRR
jgi:hypothetical protein